MVHVGTEVRRLRIERGWTQQQLANYAGLSVPAVNLIESGRRNPTARSLANLADGLGVEVGDLFPKEQPPLPFDAGGGEEQRRPLGEVEEWLRSLSDAEKEKVALYTLGDYAEHAAGASGWARLLDFESTSGTHGEGRMLALASGFTKEEIRDGLAVYEPFLSARILTSIAEQQTAEELFKALQRNAYHRRSA